jgi:predicted metal-dependent hydrolase
MSLKYELVFSKRRSISLSVNSLYKILVKAPKNTDKSYIETFVLKHKGWIEKKLEILKGNKKEGFWWLGERCPPFLEPIKPLILKIFEERLEACYQAFKLHHNALKPTLLIRKMKSRWGSLSHNSKNKACKMTLNSILIHTPLECIDYVIFHELCHIKHQNHGKGFYDLQQKLVPNYKEVRAKLREFLIEDFYV